MLALGREAVDSVLAIPVRDEDVAVGRLDRSIEAVSHRLRFQPVCMGHTTHDGEGHHMEMRRKSMPV
jgi:hypothetical protein